ncbi:UdgX family uracil-DNA binding protein [Flavisphingomonas formosensis]|uniref:UdgX family uracil-DNA binding protein n=1 Tax=Flavisphingomonas formosensis TaxID=861534 RepID=UPI0012F70912|nr:UdgX family uracil-DNA binding protein [Sphingomonas formosensis]
MHRVTLAAQDDFEGWREAARALVMHGVPPESVVWQVAGEGGDLFSAVAAMPLPPVGGDGGFNVPRGFIDIARTAIAHRDPERFALLHALLGRIRDWPGALADRADPLVRRVETMARQVRRDMHKMHAFLRFREIAEPDGAVRFVAWFEPDHHIARMNAGFFVRRFATMRWSILTPEVTLHWDGASLCEGPAAQRADAPAGDPVEQVWRTYYASIFNPARLKIGAMLKEMPKKYWKNMPETALVPELIAGAQAREAGMIRTAAKPQQGHDRKAALAALAEEARGCTRCDLHRHATQTVFGEGPANARLMIVGEQPGDQEDLAGRPFVGPAGQLFDRAMADAGLDRGSVYVTNAVKHFKFVPRGKRRLHQSPNGGEIKACRWWYEQERLVLRPRLTLAMGATAARQMFGKIVTISAARGRAHRLEDGGEGWVTVHPSFLLRVQDEADRREEYARFVEDLVQVKERLTALD